MIFEGDVHSQLETIIADINNQTRYYKECMPVLRNFKNFLLFTKL